jgi:hypothetical protein
MDAFTFLQIMRLLRHLCTSIALFVALPLLVTDYQLNSTTKYGKKTGTLQDLTASAITGSGLFVHVAAEYAITAIISYFRTCLLQPRADLQCTNIGTITSSSRTNGQQRTSIGSATIADFRTVQEHFKKTVMLTDVGLTQG